MKQQVVKLVLCLRSELGLDLLDLFVIDLKGLGKDVVSNWRSGGEECAGNRLCTLQLAVEACNHGSRHVSGILLEMDETSWEYKYFPLVDGLRDKHVGCGDEANIQGTLHHEHNLRGTGMRVWWVDAPHCVVNAGHRHTQCVKPWDFHHVYRRHK